MSHKNRNRTVSPIMGSSVTSVDETTLPAVETPTVETPAATVETPTVETPTVETPAKDQTLKIMEEVIEEEGIVKRDTAGTKVTMLPINLIKVDKEFNIRDLDAYERDQLEATRDDIVTFGLKDPLEVEFFPGDKAKGTTDHYLVIRGNRRRTICEDLNTDYYKECEKRGVKPTNPPYPKLPCRIVTNMTPADRVVHMLDQGTQSNYRPSELNKAVKLLVGLRWSEARIMKHLGKKRGEISAFFNAAELPEEIQIEHAKYLKTPKSERKEAGVPTLDRANILKLKTALDTDVEKGTNTYETLWNDIKNKKPSNGRKGSLLEALKKEQKLCMSHRKLAEYVRCLIGETDEDLAKLPELRRNIVEALKTVFPVVAITVTEGNVTHSVSVDTDTDTDDNS